MTAGGREFQVAGAAQLKDRLPRSVRLNGTSRNGTADGTAMLVQKNLLGNISVVAAGNPRITSVCLYYSDRPDLLVCSVYMPYNDRSVSQLGEYKAAVGSLQAIVDSHHGCLFVVGGDLNTEKNGNYAAEAFVHQFCSTNNLCWVDTTINSIGFSYHCDANSHSLFPD